MCYIEEWLQSDVRETGLQHMTDCRDTKWRRAWGGWVWNSHCYEEESAIKRSDHYKLFQNINVSCVKNKWFIKFSECMKCVSFPFTSLDNLEFIVPSSHPKGCSRHPLFLHDLLLSLSESLHLRQQASEIKKIHFICVSLLAHIHRMKAEYASLFGPACGHFTVNLHSLNTTSPSISKSVDKLSKFRILLVLIQFLTNPSVAATWVLQNVW
jgi:hypothetical protein